MNNKYVNHCIECSVTNCKHHNKTQNYCALEAISVGTHESEPKTPSCVDGRSFEAEEKASGIFS